MENIMKIVKSLEESGLLIKGVNETIKNEAKEQKGGFLPVLLATLAASILGNALTGKGVIRAEQVKAQLEQARFLMPPHPLSNFKIQNIKMNLNLMVFIQETIYLK